MSNMSFEDWLGKDNTIGQSIMERKYRMRGETFDEWLDRLSAGDQELRQLIKEKKFLFGGRTIANRGMDTHASYFNCYSSGFVEDSFLDIMETAKNIGMTFKAQGGQGLSLSKLRPKGTPVGKDYASDGIIPFMKLYNEVTASTSQGGARKGALLISLDAWHKEAEDFIKIKSEEGLIEKANLSLEIDDEFMEAVEEWYENGVRVVIHKKINYSGHIVEYDVAPIDIFKKLCENCWDWGDPAVIFTDKLRNYNLMQYDDEYNIETTNPCGEQPLPKHGACCLSSLNLSEFVVNPYTDKAYLDTESFVKAVKIGIRTLDKLIDENYVRHPLKQQQEMSYNYRNVGLGIFGYATALMKLGVRYGSPDALEMTDSIFGLMFRAAVIESNELAKEFGPYPKYKDCIWDSDIMRVHFLQEEIDKMREYGLRNCSLISIAPTGSIATMLGESGGCEPEFAIKYTRRTVGMTEGEDSYFDVYCKAAKEYMDIHKTDKLPDYFVSSKDISWSNRVATQAVMQRHVDTGISSTVNLPHEATIEDVENIYLTAWDSGIKGITIFREGCKRMPILSTKKNDEENTNEKETKLKNFMDILKENGDEFEKIIDDYILAHPQHTVKEVGKIRKLTTGCGSLHLVAMFDDYTGDLVEIFLNKGSSGGCNNFMIGLSRMVSLACKAGCDISTIVDQLLSCGVCPSYATRSATRKDTSPGSCCPVAIGKALAEMYMEMQEDMTLNKRISISSTTTIKEEVNRNYDGNTCPVCHSRIEHAGGCDICTNCGWSKCE